jgi:hypothetical protein
MFGKHVSLTTFGTAQACLRSCDVYEYQQTDVAEMRSVKLLYVLLSSGKYLQMQT